MKKTLLVLSLVFVLVAALTISVFALTPDEAGWYSISTADELIEFRNLVTETPGKYYAKLTADIDMTGKEWTPFGNVIIDFDGQGHTIKGLSYTTEGGNDIGLFAANLSNGGGNALFTDIVFEDCTLNVTVPNAANVGLFGGSNRGSAMGIVMKNFDITVNQTGNGELHVGGLIGRANWQHIDGTYSYASGSSDANCSITVTSSNTNQGLVRVAGLVGACYNTCVVFEACEVNATIDAPNNPAGFIKQLWGTAEVRGAKNNTGLPDAGDANKVSRPVYVTTAQEYIDAVTAMNAGGAGNTKIMVGADIDFKDVTFVPLTVRFTAALEGKGHTFSNIHLTYENVEGGNFGIIAGESQNSIITNLTIKDSSLTVKTAELGSTGAINLGGIIGWCDRTHFDGISFENVDIKLTGTLGAIANVGGICGFSQYNSAKSAISFYNCSLDAASSVTVDAPEALGTNVAGILGQFYGNKAYGANLVIQDCINNAPITGYDLAAGIVGIGGYAPGDINKIERCTNYGTITSQGVSAAIIANPTGEIPCTVTDCVAGGFIIGADGSCGQVFGLGLVTVESTKVVSIVNPITAGDDINLAAYYQTQDAGYGKINIRVLFLAELAYLNTVNELDVKVAFTKGDATIKTYEGKLDGEVYKAVSADGDMYYAPENIVIFGNIFTGVPTAEVDGFTVTVTDGAGETVYTGSAEFAQ